MATNHPPKGRRSRSSKERRSTHGWETRQVTLRGVIDRGQQIPRNAPAVSTSNTASPKPPPKD